MTTIDFEKWVSHWEDSAFEELADFVGQYHDQELALTVLATPMLSASVKTFSLSNQIVNGARERLMRTLSALPTGFQTNTHIEHLLVLSQESALETIAELKGKEVVWNRPSAQSNLD